MMFRVVMERAIDSLPVAKRTPYAKHKIAHRILDCAATGERDPVGLKIAALMDFNEVEPHRLTG
jgi:hypothetical protein